MGQSSYGASWELYALAQCFIGALDGAMMRSKGCCEAV